MPESRHDLIGSLPQHEIYKGTIHLSKPLPKWLWYILTKVVGVRTSPKDWPILGYVLLGFTLLSGLVYLSSTATFYYFDVNNTKTKFDALSYFITVIMSFGFFFIGLYGNTLARKLFSCRAFVQSLRLHSRTVLKISAPIILCAVGLGFLILFEFENQGVYKKKQCIDISITPWICHIRYVAQIVFASLAFLWNLLIAVICFSACRTHTISIRTFLLELDEDAMVYLLRKKKKNGKVYPYKPRTCSFSSPNHCNGNLYSESSPLIEPPDSRQLLVRSLSESELQHAVRSVLDDEWEQAEFQRRVNSVSELRHSHVYRNTPRLTINSNDDDDTILDEDNPFTKPDWPNLSAASGLTSYSAAPSNRMLTNEEILQTFWKLQCRLMTTSLALQRWMACWIILILAWSMVYLLYWISHEASIADMLMFCLPLFMLPIVCSGVTEVNGEGQRVAKSVCPIEERIPLIHYMQKIPIAFTLYGFALNYASLVTAIAAVAIAFATKVIVANINT